MKWHSIQALRFVAALGVVLFHLRELCGIGQTPAAFSAISLMGFTGVDIFFVISGFILWTTTRRPCNAAQVLRYLLRRLARIFTGYWPFFFLAVLLFWYFEPERLQRTDFFRAFWLIPAPLDRLLIPVSWTLSFELYFYFFFSLLLFFSERIALRILWMGFALILLANFYFVFVVDLYSPAGWGVAPRLFTFFLSPFCLEFLAGALLAHYSAFGRLRDYGWPALLCIPLLYGLGYWYQTEGNLQGPGMIGAYHYPERILLFGTAGVALVYLAQQLERERHLPIPAWLTALGDASYSLYLSHTLILYLFVRIVPWGDFQDTSTRFFLFSGLLGCILGYALVHYRWIERPLYEWAKSWLSKKKPEGV